MSRYRIEAPDLPGGYPPFVVAGVATNVVVAESDADLSYWLEEAEEGEIDGVTWTEIPESDPWHALAFWIVDNALVVLVVTVLGICGTVVGPLLLSQLNAHQRRLEKIQDNEQRLREKEEDYARQDEVARRAREVADRLIESQRHTTEQTDTVVHLIEENAAQLASINEQTAQIHILVNSDMTAARQAELDQTRATKVVLLKVIALDRAAGRQPSKDDTEAVAALDERIAELTAILADRLAAQTKVEQHMEVDAQT